MSLKTHSQDGIKYTISVDNHETFFHVFIHVDQANGRELTPAKYCYSFYVDKPEEDHDVQHQ